MFDDRPNCTFDGRADVLVVDDSPAFARIVVCAITDLGLLAVEVRSAAAALVLIEVAPPALVLSDFHMPGGSGLALLEATRARWPELPFVLWSTALPAGAADRARQLDARVAEKRVGADLDEFLRSVISPAPPTIH